MDASKAGESCEDIVRQAWTPQHDEEEASSQKISLYPRHCLLLIFVQILALLVLTRRLLGPSTDHHLRIWNSLINLKIRLNFSSDITAVLDIVHVDPAQFHLVETPSKSHAPAMRKKLPNPWLQVLEYVAELRNAINGVSAPDSDIGYSSFLEPG